MNCNTLPIPPCCDWIRRRNDGKIEVNVGLPVATKDMTATDYVLLSDISDWFKPFVKARAQANFAIVGVLDRMAVDAWDSFDDPEQAGTP